MEKLLIMLLIFQIKLFYYIQQNQFYRFHQKKNKLKLNWVCSFDFINNIKHFQLLYVSITGFITAMFFKLKSSENAVKN